MTKQFIENCLRFSRHIADDSTVEIELIEGERFVARERRKDGTIGNIVHGRKDKFSGGITADVHRPESRVGGEASGFLW